jgi:hypothetical protein
MNFLFLIPILFILTTPVVNSLQEGCVGCFLPRYQHCVRQDINTSFATDSGFFA